MYGVDPRLTVGEEIAESEQFMRTLVTCADFMAKEAARKAKG